MVYAGLTSTPRLQFEVLLDQARIARRVKELGRDITRDYAGKAPLLIGVLKGCMVFLADLIRHIDLPLEIDFVSASSYRAGSKPEAAVVLEHSLKIPLKARDVLIVEGVVDSGRTASTILRETGRLEPASIEVVTLIDKPASHRSSVQIKYRGFSLGNEFLIGYGLDNTQRYRNLPFIGRVVQE